MATKFLNFALFYAGWFACVAGAGSDMPWLGPLLLPLLLALHWAFSPSIVQEGRFLLAAGALGLLVDSAFAATGLVRYEPWLLPSFLAPLWIATLWVLFATCLSRSMSWLSGRPWLGAAFGAVGGPISYFAGARLDAIAFGARPVLTLAILATVWAGMTPLLFLLHARLTRAGGPRRSRLAGAGAAMIPLLLLMPAGSVEASPQKVQVVDEVDLERYVGKWYEIASLPNMFQRECVGTIASYTLREDGKIDVLNACRKAGLDSPEETTSGVARVVDGETNAKLKVRFFWPLNVSYWIIDLCPDYRWAVVGHPSRKYLWVISRTPTLDEVTYSSILERAAAQGYDVERLRRTPQRNDARPFASR